MKVENFLYWLQGAMEIFKTNDSFDIEQTSMITQHLKLVYEFDTKLGETPGSPFIFWLTGFLERKEGDSVTRNDYKILQSKLNKIFQHEIDPMAGDKTVQDKLNEIHKPNMTIEDAIKKFGPQPFPGARFNFHGWEDEDGGLMRC